MWLKVSSSTGFICWSLSSTRDSSPGVMADFGSCPIGSGTIQLAGAPTTGLTSRMTSGCLLVEPVWSGVAGTAAVEQASRAAEINAKSRLMFGEMLLTAEELNDDIRGVEWAKGIR